MFAESETELRDLIVQNLESCGFLNKIKAELRAGVFLALSEEGSLRKKIPVFHKKLDDFIETSEGKLAISIVREFLEHYNLGFTLSVFDPEIASTTPCMARSDLCKKLNLKESDCEGSVLSTILKQQSLNKLDDLFPDKNRPLETISENFTSMKGDPIKDGITNFFPEKHSTDSKIIKKDNVVEKTFEDISKSSESLGILSQSSNETSSDKDIFPYTKSEEKDIFKGQSSTLDPFFDEPIPSEKESFLGISSGLSEQNKLSFNADKGGLSSLKDLPSLTKQTNIFNKEIPEPVNIDSLNSLKKEEFSKKDLDPESNEFSDRQLNSEESIEEEIEEDFSEGLEELLNSSLSLGEDATSDQTVSQTSVVEGVDHIEPCPSVN